MEIRICDALKMKAEALRLTQKLLSASVRGVHGGSGSGNNTRALRNSRGMVMITSDPHTGKKKVVFFARAEKFALSVVTLDCPIWESS